MRKVRAAAAVAVAASFLFALPHASAAEEPQPAVAPYTKECQTGERQIQDASALPNVAAALKSGKTLTILAIGSSIRTGRHGRGSYRDEIERILAHAVKGLNVVMINRGVSGELAADAAARLRVEVALTDPDLVLWQVGANDALAYIPVEDVVSTVNDTINWLRAHKVDVILVGLQSVKHMQRDAHYMAVRDALRKVAQDQNVIMIRRGEALQMIKASADDKAAEQNGIDVPEAFEQSQIDHACVAEYVARAITLGVFAKTLKARNSDGQPTDDGKAGPRSPAGPEGGTPARP